MSKEQQCAIDFHNGTLLLIAGPGSGKTFVITHRIKALIDSGVDPSHILVITFTKAAASQMQSRFQTLISNPNSSVCFGTFHAIFYSIIKNHTAYRNVNPITDKEKLNMIKRALEIAGLGLLCENYDDCIETLNLISSCKNNGNNPRSFKQDKYEYSQFEIIYTEYQNLLLDFNKIDFDDMINLCLELLNSDERYLERWQSRYQYILIDEFQDISSNQYELIKLLAYPQNNIFAVGDDDQSIYKFRGSNVELMKRLLTDYTDADKKYLSTNYRSARRIVESAGKVIKDNTNRFEKTITAFKQEEGAVCTYALSSLDYEYEAIIKIIKNQITNSPDTDIAILVRSNRQGMRYASLLGSYGYECDFNNKEKPFNSPYIQDILAYMDFAAGNTARNVFIRIMNRPLRYIHRKAIQASVTKDSLISYYSNDYYMKVRIEELFSYLSRIKTLSPYLALKYIRNTIGYDEYVKNSISSDEYIKYLEEAQAFGSIIRKCRNYQEVKALVELLQSKDYKNKTASRITIMTYHGSKGLEFDTVIIPDINEGIIPPKSAREKEDIEEERRMFYVAMTRAKNNLYLMYRTDENRRPSRFIQNLVSE